MGFQDSRLWERTLGTTGGAHAEQVETLRNAFTQFREHVTPIAEDISISVPGYTDHGIRHCDSLWDTASMLTGEDFPINPAEAFVLGGAFLIHDLGMGLSAYAGGLHSIIEAPEFADLLAIRCPGDFKEVLQQVRTDVADNPTWDGLTLPVAKSVLTEYIRSQHAEQAARILSESWKLTNGDQLFLLPDTTLRLFYGECIGKVARSHWVDVAALPDKLPMPLGPIPGFPAAWEVSPVKVACILRLADALNVDASRAHPLHTPHRQPQAESLVHWQAQERLLAATVRDRRVYFSSGSSFTPERSDAWWLTYDAARMVDSELRRVDNLCADLELPRFTAHAAAGAESPARFARFVQPIGWNPVDARPFIGDQNLVMERLGGTALYGGHRASVIPLREVLANALDATRALSVAFDLESTKAVRVELRREEDADILTVRDYGVGIARDEIAPTLCNFGTSGWRGDLMRERLPGLVSGGFRPTGQFGIGFFSVFMAADRVRVVSRHIHESTGDTTILEFRGGLRDRPILKPAARNEQFLEPGTLVELELRRRVHEPGGLFDGEVGNGELTSAQFVRMIRAMALTSDVAIDARVAGDGDYLRAVNPDEWLRQSGEWLFDAMNPDADLDRHSYSKMRASFNELVADIHDEEGRVVGRVALDPHDHSNWNSRRVHSRRSYIGGLETGDGFGWSYQGVVEGKPRSASRKDVYLSATADSMKAWYLAQISALSGMEVSSLRRMELRCFGLSIGVDVPEEPIAMAMGGLLDDAAASNWIREKDTFYVLDGRLIEFEQGGEAIPLVNTLDDGVLVRLGPDVLLSDEAYGWSGELGFRDNDYLGLPEAERSAPEFQRVLRWWAHAHITPVAHLVRLAAKAWGSSLAEVAQSVYFSEPEIDADGLRLPRLDGELVEVGAWVVRRPQNETEGNI